MIVITKFNLTVNGKTTEKMTEKAIIKKLYQKSCGNFFGSEVTEMLQNAVDNGSCHYIQESDRRYDIVITIA